MPDNEQALALRRRARRRLIGAIALVLALVIIPPWIMDLEPKPVLTDLTVEIPSQASGGLKPLPAPAAAKAPEPASAPAGAEKGEPPRPAAVKPGTGQGSSALKRDVPRAAAKTETLARAAPPDAARSDAEAKRAEAILNAEIYVVPVATFSSKDNAKQLETKLAQAGVKHYVEAVSTSGGEQTRVRAGPFPTKEVAEQTREKLKGLGLDPGPVTARQ